MGAQRENSNKLKAEVEKLKRLNKDLKSQFEKEVNDLKQAELIKNIQYNIADAVVKSDNLKELFGVVRFELSRIIDTKNFYIAFYDEKSHKFYSPFEKDEMQLIPEWPAGKSLTGLVVNEQKSLLLNKEETFQLAKSNKIELIGKTAESWLGVPLKIDNKATGALVVQSYDNPDAYSDDCKKVLEIIANQLSVYIERKKAQQALKESEKRYRSVLENAFDGIYILHGKHFEFVNDRFCDITEYNREELLSKTFNLYDILTKEGQQIIDKRYDDRLKGLDVPNIVELQIYTKSGKIKDIQISNSTLSIDEEPRVLGIMRDITETKRAYALGKEVEIAKKSLEFKQNFLANISHEIRTPLTGVLGMAEVLETTELNEKQKTYLETLIQASENLREIIDLILDYAKIEAGEIKPKNIKFSLKKIILDTNEIFLPEIEKKGLKIEFNVKSEIPKLIIADRQRINQIYSNLLSNAVKFTEKGQITVNLYSCDDFDKSVTEKSSNERFFKIEVIDTGQGISEEEKKHLFKPFSKIEQSDVRVIEGTGLGLAICKELVSMLEGDIGFESQQGKGSKFYFVFKAKSVDGIPKKRITKEQKENKVKSNLNVLFVEDKKMTQKVVKLILNSMGHKVEIANNGKEALEEFKPGKFDLVLMDIQMPVMDGITATSILREKYNELPPIVGLSANAFEGDRKKYMNKGLDDYLTKPVNSDDFQELFDRLFKM